MKYDKFLEEIKKFIQKKDRLVIIVLTGILLLVIAWPVSGNTEEKINKYQLWDRKSGNIEKNIEETEQNSKNTYVIENDRQAIEEYLETKLEEMLSAMQGAGKVQVMLTLADYGEKVLEKDIPLERSNTTESDSTGGNRNISQMNTQETTVYTTNSQGDKIPYVIKEKSPVVEGVTVVAEGGGDALVQKNMTDVIQALFGIEAHKIIVVKMEQTE